MNNINFGEFIAEKRKAAHKTLREIAEELEITAPYLSDIEKTRRNPPEKHLLEKMAVIFHLDEDEKNNMFDLAGKGRKEVSADLPEYIMETPIVRAALRKAAHSGATEDHWKRFMEDLDNK